MFLGVCAKSYGADSKTPHEQNTKKQEFVAESVKLAFGDDAAPVRERRVAAVQSLSGTGSCRLFAEFQRRYMPHRLFGCVLVLVGCCCCR